MTNTTLNPSDKSAGITLTGGNLIATNNNNSLSGVRAVHAQQVGKFYWECTNNVSANLNDGVGLARITVPLTQAINSGPAGTGLVAFSQQSSGAVFYDGVGKASLGGLAYGSTLGIAVDLGAPLIWFKHINSPGVWNANPAYDPGAGTGSYPSIATVCAVDACPYANLQGGGDSITANFGASAFVGTVPTGFTAGWPNSSGGWTTWTPGDLSSMTLSNGNLTATCTGSGYVRASTDKKLAGAGKYYWEISVTKASGNSNIGFCPSALANPNYNLNTFAPLASGGTYIAGGWQGSITPAYGSVPIVMAYALDMVNNKAWLRFAPNGFWNGVAAANPATGVGGIPISEVGGGYPAFPFISLQNTSDQMTPNFGDSAFVGAAPSGFTAGWPTSSLGTTDMVVTQASVEEWIVIGLSQMELTQAAIEVWGLPPGPVIYQARAMVLA